MKVVGIDLASQPKNTAACLLHFREGGAQVTLLPGCDDRALLDAIGGAEKVGIDSPFGWPDEFVDAIKAHHSQKPWPGHLPQKMRLRETDRWVQKETGLYPLSVSTDRIGVVALRCAGLLSSLGRLGMAVDRSGQGRVLEVYPTGALFRWVLPWRRYKGPEGKAVRQQIVRHLVQQAPWLVSSSALLEGSDHLLDATLSALVARAAALSLTDTPPPLLLERARREGWIHLPRTGSLSRLLRPSASVVSGE